MEQVGFRLKGFGFSVSLMVFFRRAFSVSQIQKATLTGRMVKLVVSWGLEIRGLGFTGWGSRV